MSGKESEGEGDGGLSRFFGESEDPWLPSLSRKQRLLAFFGCLLVGAFCLSVSMLYLPIIYLKARKFALLFTLGSLCILTALAMLRGPQAFLSHMFSRERALYSLAYLGAALGTLYCAMHLHSTWKTAVCAVAELGMLAVFLAAHVPGGLTGLKFLFALWWRSVSAVSAPLLRICVV